MEIIIIILLILLNGLFAMSEIALISARRSNLTARAKQGNKAAAKALQLAQDPDRFLSTIQIGITLIGILTGTLIYTIGTDGNVIMDTLQTTFTLMGNKVDFNILIFTSLLGALVYVVAMSGGTKAYGNWAVERVKTRRATLFSTSGLGILIFIDDYFNCLSVGTVMRPLCDRYNVSRAKLAYIIDSTAAPVCIIAPVSSWAAAVGSSLKGNGVFESDMAAFIASIPWNFYALLSIFMVFFIIATGLDFGPMRRSEERAAAGDTGGVRGGGAEPPKPNPRGRVSDMLIPICALIVLEFVGRFGPRVGGLRLRARRLPSLRAEKARSLRRLHAGAS